MVFDALGQETLSSALPPTGKGSPATFRFHPRAKTVLAFARAFRWLVSAFHSENPSGGNGRSGDLFVNAAPALFAVAAVYDRRLRATTSRRRRSSNDRPSRKPLSVATMRFFWN
jgi:hypothetical protein